MPKVQMNMRVDQDLKIELDRIATTQHRTTTNLVEWLIKQYLEQIAKRSTASTALMELDFASVDDLHRVLVKRRPAIADTLHYLVDK